VNRVGQLSAAAAIILAMIAGGVLLSAQAIPEPRRGAGDSVTGAFEGW
jgi:hypothetical protein